MNVRRHITSSILLILLLLGAFQAGWSQDKIATAAAPFLGISIGVPASALGGAYVSMARDASALYWNPGAIAQLPNSQVAFTHTEWFVDTNYEWAGVVLKLNPASAVGVNLAILDYGSEEVTTVHQPDGTGEFWTAQDLYLAVSYARSLTDRFSIGGSAKYIQQKIHNESASAFALDIGVLYVTRLNGMRLGMSISNFGSDLRLDGKDLTRPIDLDPNSGGNNPLITARLKTEPYPLPLFYRVGVSMDVIKSGESSLMITTDALVPSDQSTVLNMGGELNWNDVFFLRGGYKSILRSRAEEGFTAGVGFRYMVPGLGNVSLDYAYNNFGLLEEIHILGFGFNF